MAVQVGIRAMSKVLKLCTLLLLAVAGWSLIYNLFIRCTIGSCAVSGMPVALPLMGASILYLVSRLLGGSK